MKTVSKKLHIVLFLLGAIATTSFAQEMAVPVNLQAALFKKIFSFDRTLASKGVEVAVLGAGGDAVAAALKDAGVNAKAVSGDQVPGGVTVVYTMSGATKSQTAAKGILSISGVSGFAESGKVAIGLSVEGGKPKIVINMAQLKAESQELAADLLKIAKLIQ
ncbi:MAG TPA: YfiR family protein [Bacteroidota bacterium]|nr:YfiR family protein [Bacteroidota bacterium]